MEPVAFCYILLLMQTPMNSPDLPNEHQNDVDAVAWWGLVLQGRRMRQQTGGHETWRAVAVTGRSYEGEGEG